MTVNVKTLGGAVISGWVLDKEIGAGADGIVYSARKDNQVAAVKVFFPEVIANGQDEAMERLELQLSLAGKKHHPNLVEIFDGGRESDLDNVLFLVMELVPGNSLDKVLEEVPADAIPSLVSQLASAASFLHEKGLAHRDIKPANVVISHDFTKLTLLDLGIVLNTCRTNDERLSGKEFVATLRYSPPEFVYRKEESSLDEAWLAISFYQIGATLYDMIIRRPLFDGYDQPRGRLYDAVRWRSPDFAGANCPEWLVTLAKCCLVKNWRERLRLISWRSFSGPPEQDDMAYRMKLLKLRQIRGEEMQIRDKIESEMRSRQDDRIRELWDLHNGVFLETRQFLMEEQLFPRFGATYNRITDKKYQHVFTFYPDEALMFKEPVEARMCLSVEEQEVSTELWMLVQLQNGETLFNAKWTEMLTVASAAALIQGALIEVAGKIIPEV